jgi:two-component system, chemotaxis family, protein-glutamate methylesterase/glutaminase
LSVPGHDIIVVGASAGGVGALRTLVKGLPPDLSAAVFVVLHVSPHGTSLLPTILNRAADLPCEPAADGDPVQPGRVYVGVPDRHLMVDRGTVRVMKSPKENRLRPSVDVLLRSAAVAYGPRVLAVVLTGTLDDGAAGVQAVKHRGGTVLVQDPREAAFPDMPRAAIETGAADHTLPLAEIAPALVRLVQVPALPDEAFPVPPELDVENRIAHMEKSDPELVGKIGSPSSFTCPDCHGVLWQVDDARQVRFRCQVGHAYAGSSLIDFQWDGLEDTLWAAVRAFNESVGLARKLEASAHRAGRHAAAQRFRNRAEQAAAHADRLRAVIESQRPSPVLPEEEEAQEAP